MRRLSGKNPLLIRLILSFILTGALLTGLLLILVSGFVSGQITAQSRQNAGLLLEQAYNTSYGALTDIYGDFYYMWAKDPVIAAALAATSLTGEQEAAISKLLDATAFRDPLVHSVCLINKDTGRVLSNLTAGSDLSGFYDQGALALFDEFEKNYQTYKNEVFFPRQAAITLSGKTETRHYISIVLATQTAGGQLRSGLIVSIDQDRLSALVNISPLNGHMMVVSRSGRIISDLDASQLGQNFSEAALYQQILTGPAATGSLTADYLGEKCLITYKKADTLGFVFLSIIPLVQLLAPVRQTNQIIVLLFAAAILLSLAASLLATRRIYRPLDRLIRAMQNSPAIDTAAGQDEYAYLDAAFGNLIAQNQQAHLIRLLQGHASEQTLEILGFGRTCFLAVVLIPDQPDLLSRTGLEQFSQMIQKTLHLPVAAIAADCAALIINADLFDDTEMDWILAQIAILQRMGEMAMQTTAAVGIGTVTDTAAGVPASYRSALAAARQAAAMGSNQVVPFSEIEHSRLSTSQNRLSVAAAIDEQILANYARPGFTIEEIAEHVGLSVGYSRQIYKLERGLPINEQLIACRIGKARELLATTDLTAREISEMVGYLDSRYFYTLFKKKTGMTTEEYRRSIHEEARHDQN